VLRLAHTMPSSSWAANAFCIICLCAEACAGFIIVIQEPILIAVPISSPYHFHSDSHSRRHRWSLSYQSPGSTHLLTIEELWGDDTLYMHGYPSPFSVCVKHQPSPGHTHLHSHFNLCATTLRGPNNVTWLL